MRTCILHFGVTVPLSAETNQRCLIWFMTKVILNSVRFNSEDGPKHPYVLPQAVEQVGHKKPPPPAIFLVCSLLQMVYSELKCCIFCYSCVQIRRRGSLINLLAYLFWMRVAVCLNIYATPFVTGRGGGMEAGVEKKERKKRAMAWPTEGCGRWEGGWLARGQCF